MQLNLLNYQEIIANKNRVCVYITHMTFQQQVSQFKFLFKYFIFVKALNERNDQI